MDEEKLEKNEELQINKPYQTTENILINSILNSQPNKKKIYRANSTTLAENNCNLRKHISKFTYKEK